MEAVYEQFFYLKYVGGWSFIEAYNLPVGLRNWFTERLAEQLKKENEKIEEARSGNSSNSHELSRQGMSRMPPSARAEANKYTK